MLLTGEQFTASDHPSKQICEITSWSSGIEALFSSFECAAIISGKPAILAIDALNESRDRNLWCNHLHALSRITLEFPNVRFLVSCRSDFIRLTLPTSLAEGRAEEWSQLEHKGFDMNVFEAVDAYFNGYSVSVKQFPPLLDEFKNPLFLKILCEAYAGNEIPEGKYAFVEVMKKRINTCCSAVSRAIDCPIRKTQTALSKIARLIAENSGNPIPVDKVEEVTEALFSANGESQSLYHHLKSNRMLFEVYVYSSADDGRNKNKSIAVRFPYERFSDYLIAEQMLGAFKSLSELKASWDKDGLPDGWIDDYQFRYANRGILKMMAILLPEKFGVEFLELFESTPRFAHDFAEDYMESLAWRTKESIGESSENLLNYARETLHEETYLNAMFRLVTIPRHPYNAEVLHQKLLQLKLWERDACWTIPITNLTSYDKPNAIDDIIKWAFVVPKDRVSDEQAWLAALFLSWILGSNYKLLRRRVSLALIRLLEQRSHIAERLLGEFHGCNDPYVVERVYAVACGVALRERDESKLLSLATSVYELTFKEGEVPAHILQRDYAQAILERANHLNLLDYSVVDINRCRPPFKTRWPRIISEKQANEIESRDGWNTIKRSIQPEEAGGMYGDFGRYTMGASVHHFSNQRLNRKYKKPEVYASDRYNANIARRYILGRIRSMGWKPKAFEKHESHLYTGRMRADKEDNKVERISKKYQWIGLHEFLAYLSDRFWSVPGFGDEASVYTGAWESLYRDFDPTHPLIDPQLMLDGTLKEEASASASIEYPDLFADPDLRSDRVAWVKSKSDADDNSALLQPAFLEDSDCEWLCLSGHYNWKEPLTASQNEAVEGILKMWTDVRCWLVPQEDKNGFLESVRELRFWGNGCDTPELHNRWIGEYPWGRQITRSSDWFEESGWFGMDNSVLEKCYHCCCGFRDERSNFFPRLPAPLVLQIMGLKWSGLDYSYLDDDGNLKALCVPVNGFVIDTNGILLVEKSSFLTACHSANLVPMWATLSERSCYSYESSCSIVNVLNVNQRIYEYQANGFREVHCLDYEIPFP